jgi:hypothetical protein
VRVSRQFEPGVSRFDRSFRKRYAKIAIGKIVNTDNAGLIGSKYFDRRGAGSRADALGAEEVISNKSIEAVGDR